MRQWDDNTAKFDALPPAEKIIQLAIKKSKDEAIAQEKAAQAEAQAQGLAVGGFSSNPNPAQVPPSVPVAVAANAALVPGA